MGGQSRRGKLGKFSSDCFNISINGPQGQQLRVRMGEEAGVSAEDVN